MTCDDDTVLLVALTPLACCNYYDYMAVDNLKWLHFSQFRDKALYMNTRFKHRGNS